MSSTGFQQDRNHDQSSRRTAAGLSLEPSQLKLTNDAPRAGAAVGDDALEGAIFVDDEGHLDWRRDPQQVWSE